MRRQALPGAGRVNKRRAIEGTTAPPAPPARCERRALAVAQSAAAVALIGTLASPALTNAAALILLLAFALLPSVRRRLAALAALPLVRASLALSAALALAMLWADAPWKARLDALWDWRALLLMIACLAIFDERGRRRALLAFVAAASLGAAYSFWAWAHGFSTVTNNHGMAGIVLRNPVTQGMGLALGCFLALSLAFDGRDLDRRLRLALLAAALLIVVNLVLVTSGRTGHVLLLVLFAGLAVQQLSAWRRVAALAALPLLAALALGVSPMLQKRFGLLVDELRAPLASPQLSAIGIRTVMWDVSWQMARERPLLGYGTGSFPGAYRQALAKTGYSGWAATPAVDPHNQYLQVHLQAGILGSAAFAWFLWAAFRHRGRGAERTSATAVLAGWCVAGLATSVFTTFAESHMLLLLLGILLAGDRPADAAGMAGEGAGDGARSM